MDEIIRNVTETAIHHVGVVQRQFLEFAVVSFLLASLSLVTQAARMNSYLDGMKPKWEYATKVRVYAGSNPFHGDYANLAGHQPDISLWTEGGKKIGHVTPDWQNKNRKIAQGAFADLYVPHHKSIQGARPHYLNLIARGKDGLCISGIDVKYPDGHSVTITADVVKRCAALQGVTSASGKDLDPIYDYSYTQMGFDDHAPACFWLDADRSFPYLWMTGISFKLPDFEGNDARRDAWNRDPAQLCGPSPRMFYHEGKVNVDTPVPIWNPPFKYNPDTTDKEANRVRDWRTNLADRHFSVHGRDLSSLSNGTAIEYENDANEMLDESIPFQPRQLVKSHHPQFSARQRCYNGTNTGEDYVSMAEGIFCDMKLRNMWHLCEGPFTKGCFDVRKNELRGFDLNPHIDHNRNKVNGWANVTSYVNDSGIDAISHVAKREARSRMFKIPDTAELYPPPIATTNHDGAVYGMRYERVKVTR